MSGITTHVLDTAHGDPAAEVRVRLEQRKEDAWVVLTRSVTDANGRSGNLVPDDAMVAGTYRLRFEVGEYFSGRSTGSFYPYVDVVFEVADPNRHYHVPLLASPYGFSTYRGS